MATQFEIDCALMAGRAYQTNRDPSGINWFPVPSGWAEFKHVPNPLIQTTGGFEMSVFQNSNNPNNIVISFAGTNPYQLGDWISGNVPLAFGVVSDQLTQAVDYYLQVKAANPRATFTFTGHSLGGGIAALMGTFFGSRAVTFDQAPFAKTAAQDWLSTTNGAHDLQIYLNSKPYTDPAMVAARDTAVADLGTFLQHQQINGGIPNSDLVSTIRVEGEFTSAILGYLFDPIGAPATLFQHGTTNISAFTELHDMALLTTFMQSDATASTTATGQKQSLSQVTFKLTDLLAMIFDKKLFAYDKDKPDANFLEHLVRHQAGGVDGVSAGGDAMVTRFTADLWKLAQDGGMTMNEGIWSNYSNWNNVSKALTAFAMQFYYEENNPNVTYGTELFTNLTTAGTGSNGIQFDMHDVSKDIATAMDANAEVDLTKAKGYQYFLNYLDTTSTFTPQERALIKTMLPQLRDWYVQAGAAGMTAADTMGRGAFMLGGNSSDAMAGSHKTDLLVGNAGDDIFLGNQGNDVLLGGTGNDIYAYAKGDGLDTILDTDGNGTLQIDNNRMSGGEQFGDNKVFRGKDANGVSHLYTFVTGNRTIGGDLMVDGAMLIKDFKPGLGNHMGITFSDTAVVQNPQAPAMPTTTRDISGDALRMEFTVTLATGTYIDPAWKWNKLNEVVNTTTQNVTDSNGNVIGTIQVPDGTTTYTYNQRDDLDNWILDSSKPDATQADGLNGSADNDHIMSGGGGDTINAIQGGDDLIEVGDGNNTVNAGSGNDVIIGGINNDTINAGNGNNYIVAGDGINTITVGTGNDIIQTGDGRDILRGGDGDNYLEAGAERDWLYAGTGKDTLIGGTDADVLSGGAGDDRLYADTQIEVATAISNGSTHAGTGQQGDWLAGGSGSDILIGSDANDVLAGGGGTDLLIAGAGDDHILGDSDWVANSLNWTVSASNFFQPVSGEDIPADAAADVIYAGNGNDKVWAGDGNDVVFGEANDDYLAGNGGNDTLIGGDGKDILWGDTAETGGVAARNMGDDYLDGGAGDDQLNGNEGNDILIGGADTDNLYGGAGQDTYIFNKGDGVDHIYDTKAEKNIIRVGAGFDKNAIKLHLGSLVVDFGEGDMIHINNQEQAGKNGFDQNDVLNSSSISGIEFEDGSIITIQELIARGFDLDGTAGDDQIIGTNTTDRIQGFAGNDTLIGLGGADTISGGDGDDSLHGDADTITVPLADQGDDKLDGGAGNDVLYGYGGNDELYGGDGIDGLHGGVGDDLLVGGVGNDLLSGDEGGDTYLFSRGDGQDVVVDGGDAASMDALKFAADVLQSDVAYRRTVAGDLEFSIVGTSDTITIRGWYTNEASANRMERVVFGDGTALSQSDFENLPISATEGNDTVEGTSANDSILGLGGNDQLNGKAGDDTLDGGAGDDVLDGGKDTDLLIGGAGMDTYQFGYGMDQDTWVDVSPEGSLIALQPGIHFTDLRAEQSGNDLLLTIRGTDQSTTIKDYYITPQDWVVQDGDVQKNLTEILNATNQDEYSVLRDDFYAQLKNSIGSIYTNFEWQQDGSLVNSPIGDVVSQQSSQTTNIITTTYHWFNGNPDSVTTNTYVNPASLYTTFPEHRLGLLTTAIKFERTSVSDENGVTMQAVDGFAQSNSGQLVAAQMNWGVPFNVQTSSWPTSSGGFIYGAYGVVLGTVGTVNQYVNTQFQREGTISAILPYGTSISDGIYVRMDTSTYAYQLQELIGGSSDNSISAYNNSYAVLNGGAGNDTLSGGGLLYGGEGNDVLVDGTYQYGGNGNDLLSNGDTLDGGAGDDVLTTGRVLVGGAGNDTMDGGYAATRYVIDPTQSGTDLVIDGGNAELEFTNWYYQQRGITDFQTSADWGGMYVIEGEFGSLPFGQGNGYQFYFSYDQMPAIQAEAPWLANYINNNPQLISYIEPIPPFERPAANDYAALQAAYDSGIVPVDTVEFGAGISLADLSFTWGIADDGVHNTLDLSWNSGASKVRLVVPNADDPIGLGVEQVTFVDGNMTVGMQDLIALAPSMDKTIVGTEFDDVLNGGIGNDTLIGLAGADELIGGAGDDVLNGGTGNDILMGGSGNDTYAFEVGDGIDSIVDSSGSNTLVFGAGVDPASITLSLGSLLIQTGNAGDAIHIQGFDPSNVFASPVIESFQFADGTTLSYAQLLERGFDITGSNGDDVLNGTNTTDRISGGDGNDVLNGGAGNDVLMGGAGSDTYIFDVTSGQDTIVENSASTDPSAVDKIVFGTGVTTSQIRTTKSGPDNADLTISINGTGASITVQGWFSATTPSSLSVLEFSDGSTVSVDSVLNHAPSVIHALADQSVQVGQQFSLAPQLGSNFLTDATDTGTANQVWPTYYQSMVGDVGDNTYVISLAAGNAVVWDWDATAGNVDTIQLTDVLSSSVTISQDIWGSVTLTDSVTQNILTLESWLSSDAYKIEQIVFADGVTWGISDIQSRISTTPSSSNDFIQGTTVAGTIHALAGDDRIEVAAGNDTVLAGAGNDLVIGGGGSDILIGGSGSDEINGDWDYADIANDLLDGGAGDDYIYSGISSDLLIGAAGNDEVAGDDGNDVFLFNRGDGNDRYYQGWSENGSDIAQRTDTISLGGGISYADLTLQRDGNNLILNVGSNESITLDNWFYVGWDTKAVSKLQVVTEAMPEYDVNSTDPLLNQRIQQFDFLGLANQFEAALAADPTIITWQLAPALADFSLGGSDTTAIGGDMAYLYGKNGNLDGLSETELRSQLNDASFGTGSQILTKLGPVSTSAIFTDVDFIHGDSLTYNATLADGSALPSWLTFDATTQTFSGTPANGDAGRLSVAVIATDTGGLSATTLFNLDVISLNTAPVAVADLVAISQDDFTSTIAVADLLANDTDADVGDTLRIASFDTITADGNMVTQDANGDFVLDIGSGYQSLAEGETVVDRFTYTIADAAGEVSTATVDVTIAGVNDAPIVATVVDDQQADEDVAFSFTLPAGTFTDIDNGDVLSYSVTMADGSPLPGWISFDTATQIFSGTPSNAEVGNLGIVVTATDSGGLSVSTAFNLSVANVNDAPVVTMQIADQLLAQGSSLNLALPAGMFTDQDFIHGDSLTYSATLADGTPLPTWLSIDSATGLLSGTAGGGDLGAASIAITATDLGGLSATAQFNLTVANVITGTIYNDTLNGTAGVDFIQSLAGNDVVNAGDGNDVIGGGAGSDVLAGGAGDDIFKISGTDAAYDRFQGDAGFDSIVGGDANDTIRVNYFSGTSTVELIDGGLGLNVVAGSQYNDTIDMSGTELIKIANIDGGVGNDVITGSAGNDTIIGGVGSDVLAGGSGDDTFLIDGIDVSYDRFQGDVGFDTIQGGTGDDVIRVNYFSGASTVERIDGGAGLNTIAGSQYNDTVDLSGTELANIANIDGGIGNDVITGSSGNDTIIGGVGSDVLAGGLGDDTFLINGTDAAYDRFQGGDGFDVVLGGSADDTIRVNYFSGTSTVEQIDGGAGINTIAGSQYNDTIDLAGTELVNIANIDGGVGNDVITGSAGGDIIIGGIGSDVLLGGLGDDTFLVNGSDVSYDRFQGDSGYDVIQGGAQDDVIRVNYFSVASTVEKIDGGAGINTLEGSQYNDTIDLAGTELTNIAHIDGGIGNDVITGSIGNDVIMGGSGSDVLVGGAGDDIFQINGNDTAYDRFQGDAGFDAIQGGADDDVIRVNYFAGASTVERIDGGAGLNVIAGSQYNDTMDLSGTELLNIGRVDGGVGNDVIMGSTGNDILQGGLGSDILLDTSGNNILDGGDGADVMTGGAGNEMFIGGTGNDTITTGNGADIIAFNRGDGLDTVNGGIGTDNTISLGQGINYSDIALSKVNNNLILEVGAGEQITLTNWYNTAANYKSVIDLQVMADAMTAFDATSADPLLNQAVQNFDFTAIVNAFDQANGGSATFMHWSATNSLLTSHLSGSDTTALGGDLAHQYGTNGTLAGMNLTAAQTALNDPQFGAAQTLRPLQGLQGGAVTL